MFALVAISGALAGRALGGGGVALVLALSAMFLSRCALADQTASPWLARIAVLAACAGGTSFRGADLRGAKLRGATLSCTDFRGAELTGADFEDARLDLCAFDMRHRDQLPSQCQTTCYFAAEPRDGRT
jgi:hypothetical protein